MSRDCRDCKHSKLWSVTGGLLVCDRKGDEFTASVERGAMGMDSCGPGGQFFEPREVTGNPAGTSGNEVKAVAPQGAQVGEEVPKKLLAEVDSVVSDAACCDRDGCRCWQAVELMSKRQRSLTPEEFRDVLLEMARGAA